MFLNDILNKTVNLLMIYLRMLFGFLNVIILISEVELQVSILISLIIFILIIVHVAIIFSNVFR